MSGIILRVDVPRWRAHLRRTLAETPGLVPVDKGNGYGYGLVRLAQEAARLGVDTLAVGMAEEVAVVRDHFTADLVVLTPWRPDDEVATALLGDSNAGDHGVPAGGSGRRGRTRRAAAGAGRGSHLHASVRHPAHRAPPGADLARPRRLPRVDDPPADLGHRPRPGGRAARPGGAGGRAGAVVVLPPLGRGDPRGRRPARHRRGSRARTAAAGHHAVERRCRTPTGRWPRCWTSTRWSVGSGSATGSVAVWPTAGSS